MASEMVADNNPILRRCRPHVCRRHRRHDSNRALKAMRMKKFEYFLNAVHYCMWIREKKVYAFLKISGDRLFSPLKYLFTKNFRKRYHESRQKLEPQWDDSWLNRKDGFCVGWAHHWMGYFSACYPGFISFVLLGLGTRWFGRLPSLVVIALIAIPLGSFYIPFYKALYTKDRYLKNISRSSRKKMSAGTGNGRG